jgi:diguanylate cyclase (GGDEF)-like protein
MSRHDSHFAPASPVSLDDENALLRASLAEARARIGELEEGSDRDPRTRLPNRRRFLSELARVVGQAGRHGATGALLFIDLKGLGRINDAHGRIAGDATLVHVAKLLSGLIRATDILARVGGDEFGLILDHLDHNSAIDTADRLARCIAAHPVDLGSAQVAVEVSIGTAAILPGDSASEVMQRADRNMKLAQSGL